MTSAEDFRRTVYGISQATAPGWECQQARTAAVRSSSTAVAGSAATGARRHLRLRHRDAGVAGTLTFRQPNRPERAGSTLGEPGMRPFPPSTVSLVTGRASP
jgi:hypothetical protein